MGELLGLDVKVTLMCDSQNAIHLSKNQAHHKRTKHIDIQYHFIRDIIENKLVELTKVAGEKNVVDMFTKAVPVSKLQQHIKLLNIVPDQN